MRIGITSDWYFHFFCTDIDLQLVNLIKSLINPENMSMSMETNPNVSESIQVSPSVCTLYTAHVLPIQEPTFRVSFRGGKKGQLPPPPPLGLKH